MAILARRSICWFRVVSLLSIPLCLTDCGSEEATDTPSSSTSLLEELRADSQPRTPVAKMEPCPTDDAAIPSTVLPEPPAWRTTFPIGYRTEEVYPAGGVVTGDGSGVLLLRGEEPIDTVDARFGGYRVGEDSLVYIRTSYTEDRSDPVWGGPEGYFIEHDGRQRRASEALGMNIVFSSFSVINREIVYWGFYGSASADSAYAARYNFETSRIDSVTIPLELMPTGFYGAYYPPFWDSTAYVFMTDDTAFRVSPDFESVAPMKLEYGPNPFDSTGSPVPYFPHARIDPENLPPGYAVTDTSTWEEGGNWGPKGVLRRGDMIVDTINLFFGVTQIGNGELFYQRVRSWTTWTASGSRTGLILRDGDLSVPLNDLLPLLDPKFSSPRIVEGELLYWGLEDPTSAAELVRPALAMRYDFGTGQLDSIRLHYGAPVGGNMDLLFPPFREGSDYVFRVDRFGFRIDDEFGAAICALPSPYEAPSQVFDTVRP